MEEIKSFRLELEVPYIMSENTYLAAGYARGRPYLYKRPDCKNYQESIVRQLAKYDAYLQTLPVDFMNNHFTVCYAFYLKTEYDSRDVSNMVKILEDAIVTYLKTLKYFKPGYDDSRSTEGYSQKIMLDTECCDSPSGDEYGEYIEVTFKIGNRLIGTPNCLRLLDSDTEGD